MAVFIKNIRFINYRQYRDVSLSFDYKDQRMNAIVAENGTGKTTLLNGINWCLYGIEPNLTKDDTTLPIINEKVINSLSDGDTTYAEVIMSLEEDGNSIEISRRSTYGVIEELDGTKNLQSLDDDLDGLTVRVNYSESKKNAEILTGDDADIRVKQYFDREIREYYFFDGEKLEDYFTNNRSKMIRDSIFNIAQVTLLENTVTRLETIAREKARVYSQDVPELEELQAKKASLESDIVKLNNNIQEYKDKTTGASSRIEEINEILKNYGPVKEKQNEREHLIKEIQQLETSKTDKLSEKKSIIRKGMFSLKMYPVVKRLYDYILEKEKKGQFPPEVDKKKIEKTLKEHECDFCHSHLTAEGEEYLLDLLKQLSVSNRTSTYLVSLKSTYETMISDAKNYRKEMNQVNASIEVIDDEILVKEKKVEDISSFLSNYVRENDSEEKNVNVSELEEERKQKSQDKDNYIRIELSFEQEKSSKEKDLEGIKEQIKNAEATKVTNTKLKQEADVLTSSAGYLRGIQNGIMLSIKSKIQEQTWSLFNNVIWKENSFSAINIDDNYSLSVIGSYGHEASGSLSATEKMALAYAFTFAIHTASGKNCPVVIDSPLGRTAGLNKSNLVEKFVEISKTKQIVLLLTEDECSPQIQELLRSHGISIKGLKLTHDEKEINFGGFING